MRSYPLLSILMLFSQAALAGIPSPSKTARPKLPKEPSQSVIAADNAFGFKLLKLIIEHGGEENVAISPLSAATTLQMTSNGARGYTQAKMLEALQASHLTMEQINRSAAELILSLHQKQPHTRLRIADGIWLKPGFKFQPDFLRINQTDYKSELGTIHGDPSIINNWVNRMTDGHIPHLFSSSDLRGNTAAILVNALYFHGNWLQKFDSAQTKLELFNVTPQQKERVPMMHQHGKYSYLKTEEFQSVALPYEGGRMEADFILPNHGVSTRGLLNNLTERWTELRRSYRSDDGEIAIPKFTIVSQNNLKNSLESLGMGIAFDPGHADLSGMAGNKGDLWIGKVVQKCFLQIDEHGATAAAATGAIVTMKAVLRPQNPFQLILDRPFLLLLRDAQTGSILFMARITNPKTRS